MRLTPNLAAQHSDTDLSIMPGSFADLPSLFAQDAAASNGTWSCLILLADSFVLFYFMLIRPSSSRRRSGGR